MAASRALVELSPEDAAIGPLPGTTDAEVRETSEVGPDLEVQRRAPLPYRKVMSANNALHAWFRASPSRSRASLALSHASTRSDFVNWALWS